MSRPIKLEDLIDEMKCQFDAYTLYFSKKMGKILTVWNEEFDVAEEDYSGGLGNGKVFNNITADFLKNEIH